MVISGVPYVMIKAKRFTASESKEVKIGKGNKCIKCRIEAPLSDSDYPKYYCNGPITKVLKGKFTQISRC